LMEFAIFFLYISCGPYYSCKNWGFKQWPTAEPHMG
jgi:hypothetical protein